MYENRLALNVERWAQLDKPYFSAPGTRWSALSPRDTQVAGVGGGGAQAVAEAPGVCGGGSQGVC